MVLNQWPRTRLLHLSIKSIICLYFSSLDSLPNISGTFCRGDAKGEVANQQVHLPGIIPKYPGRFYYYFGKPIETKGIYAN